MTLQAEYRYLNVDYIRGKVINALNLTTAGVLPGATFNPKLSQSPPLEHFAI
jgi:hypothetical protein